ncbi:MAG: hypothetical protein IKM08_01845 [Clostridia bacterium]|nr:hypothetical protein [Clostridia bacterium]
MTKKHLRFPALVLLSIYAIGELILYPLAKKSGSDIIWFETFWIYILDFLYPLMGWLGIGAAFGFAVYGVFRFGVRRSIPLFLTILGAMIAKNIMNIISYSVFNGSFLLTKAGFIYYSSLFLTSLFECLFIVFVILLAHFGIKRLNDINAEKERCCKRLKKSFTPEGETLPFTKIFHRKNPLLVAIMVTSVTYTFSQILYFALKISINIDIMEIYQIPIFFVTAVLIPAIGCFFSARFCIKLAEWDHLRIEARALEEDENEDEDEDEDETAEEATEKSE